LAADTDVQRQPSLICKFSCQISNDSKRWLTLASVPTLAVVTDGWR